MTSALVYSFYLFTFVAFLTLLYATKVCLATLTLLFFLTLLYATKILLSCLLCPFSEASIHKPFTFFLTPTPDIDLNPHCQTVSYTVNSFSLDHETGSEKESYASSWLTLPQYRHSYHHRKPGNSRLTPV